MPVLFQAYDEKCTAQSIDNVQKLILFFREFKILLWFK